MAQKSRSRASVRTEVVGHNPLEGEQLLLEALYGQPKRVDGLRRSSKTSVDGSKPEKPQHYKIVSISLYRDDIKRLEELVAELKRRGYSRANKSLIIRQALSQLDLDRFPKQA